VYEFISFSPPIWEEQLVLTWGIVKIYGEVYRDGWIFTDTEGGCEYRPKRSSFRIKDYGQQGQDEGVLRELGSEDEPGIHSMITSEEHQAEYRRKRDIMMGVEEDYDADWRMR